MSYLLEVSVDPDKVKDVLN
jgi:hypothetical protein